ncbi:MAG: hypothetical protein AABZ74_03190, partial [Cyanobacteriota bacterium]
MQFKSFDTNIEVIGQTVFAIVDGLGHFKSFSKKYLLSVGIGIEKDGQLELDPNAWYSQDAWLVAFEKISKDIGNSVLFNIGSSIPKNAIFPPFVKDIESAIMSIDIAYHMNHRINGKEMFNPATGAMMEGIGHYKTEKVSEREVKVICENPYP